MNRVVTHAPPRRERAIIVGLVTRSTYRWTAEEFLDELALLADTAGAEVVGRVLQERSEIDPAYFIGRGKVSELRALVKQEQANLILFDDDLSPAQVRNLERDCGARVVDRSGLILDIFARRARTREAKTQVELAQLEYLLPRLTRQWTHLSRQEGGIGLRGPGETQLEIDRRQIRRRINFLRQELEKIHRQRAIRRKHREELFQVALVGYTNVGKSTILNALTRADVLVEDRLFATLDPTVRIMDSDGRRTVVLIDTVGFIRKLPHHLVASFMSTLQESMAADLLVHVVDVSHPQFAVQMDTVREVLRSLNALDRPILTVFNKVDRLTNTGLLPGLLEAHRPSIAVSATRGIFMDRLREEILRFAEQRLIEFEMQVPAKDSRLVAKLYALADVLEADYQDGQVLVKARATRARLERIRRLAHGWGQATEEYSSKGEEES
ncbi:MAG: GTPase HflX [Calditrichaeota bacterium]|nr:GTPase HflX [Calditrichota bacterium]